MKTHKIEIKENAVLIILYLSIIAGLMAFVPERINTILKILFITGAFVNVAKRNFVVKFGRAEKSFDCTVFAANSFFKPLFNKNATCDRSNGYS